MVHPPTAQTPSHAIVMHPPERPRSPRARAQAFPFAGKVPGPICAICCIQCIPNAGIMKPPGGGGAPPNAEMNR